jgi:hypothetical protein
MDTRETNSPDYLSPELKNLDFAYFVGGMVTGFFFFFNLCLFVFHPLPLTQAAKNWLLLLK